MLSSILQLMFFFEKDSDAAAKMAISSTPTDSAVSRPFIFGTRTG
jgi:hypothetical protein